MAVHTLQKLGENETGDKAGVELPRDDLRQLGLMDDEGNLKDQPAIGINLLDTGEGDSRPRIALEFYLDDKLTV